MILRLFVSGLLAVLVSVLLFIFMIRLLSGETIQQNIDQAVTRMQFVEPPPDEAEPQTTPEQAVASEPSFAEESMMPVATLPQTVAAPAPSALPQPKMSSNAFNVPAPKSSWSAPLSGDAFQAGEKGKGFVEVIPLATRRPNIPEVAWENKIDGWVLVAFTLKPDGRTANVRVLDARPGGVYEDNVIRAVQDWLYDMRSIKHKGDIILTQKIELFWRDYPDNTPYLD
ncbi:energy transducer TonB [Ketobacter alkanivorans]|uniref:Protein TonB n=1 Tax=Ketobacter alkanivorans TaxID=1917421 RepID=A0A2K9LNM4_9GAMM|nr:energy transducer TonB [Ketobacter alkanivorans]AUM13956.1 hypothetical protein Kalk_16645 [Ketobacter alkanivorans]